ncbi:hypothetical protein EYF80_002628 [Liparis tanakae]|uniref:Uncharacterized protein n=1 Tax=Liparis tanakae TaxID=230148 RepID=A0A4Z2JAU7_9TELE|nr:hypothetical protein EYF80_002628 [Liparis tanakae]
MDPGSGGDGSFDQAFAEHLLEFGLEVEVLETSVDGDEQAMQARLCSSSLTWLSDWGKGLG